HAPRTRSATPNHDQVGLGLVVAGQRVERDMTVVVPGGKVGVAGEGAKQKRDHNTAFKDRNPARVTMKDGIPSRAMIVPWMRPTTAQKASAAAMAAHQGQFVVTGWTSWTAITAPHAPT